MTQASIARAGMAAPMTFVALLRGVNVGGKNMISMASLNERKIEAILSKQYQLDCKVVVRSLPEMARLVKSLPRTWNGDSRWRYNVIFLRHTIDSENVLANLAPKPDIEQVVYRPGTLLWSAHVSHLSRTTMLKLSGQKIFQDMTVRNLNTTKKLYELMRDMAQS